jgi:hypothetical protein
MYLWSHGFQAEEHVDHIQRFICQLTMIAGEPAEIRAKNGYDRYVAHCGGVSVHGESLPQWKDQKEEVQQHWIAVFTE